MQKQNKLSENLLFLAWLKLALILDIQNAILLAGIEAMAAAACWTAEPALQEKAVMKMGYARIFLLNAETL